MYKRNREIYGNVETYEGGLVAKGYSQKSCFDYEETFSPMAMIKSIIILLSIGTYYDYKIWKMAIKTVP